MSNQLLNSTICAMARENLGVFFEGYCWIQEKGGAFREGAPMHADQRKTVEVIRWCRENKKPCRILKLKPRRGGSSTISTAALYNDLMSATKRGCIMGGSEFQGNSLFSMLRLMSMRDRTVKQRAQVLDAVARFPNGSTVDRINASNPTAGLAAGYEFMIATELAKWSQEGVAAADEVLNGALKCVPYLPGTTIIIESTADGCGNEYHRRYQKSITFDELKAGKEGYVRIFSAWFEFEDYVKEPSSEGISSDDDLTQEERDLKSEYSLTLSQIAWMRHSVSEYCGNNFEDFKENYPFNDVECFLLTGRKAFSATGLQKMKDQIYAHPTMLGTLDLRKGMEDSVVWRSATPAETRMVLLEHPVPGRKYLISVDPMTGASQTSGDDPDNHGVTIWRSGFFDQGRWCPHKIVGMLVDDWELWMRERKYSLRWDIDVLTDQVWRAALYFGNCMIIPEMNMERGMVELLKLKGANIYIRKLWNKREQIESNAYGWVTTPETRGRIVTELAKGIREFGNIDPIRGHSVERVEIFLPPILDEIETFILRENGRAEAMQGKHDDLVLSAGIGLCCIDQATTYQRPQGQSEEPAWMREQQPTKERSQYV
jgi:hypothetical protein